LDEYCATLLTRSIGLPTHPTLFKALELINNSAFAYGNDIATSPYEIMALGDASKSLRLIPMITPVNVSMILKDRFGQIVKGTTDVPIPYILQSWTCNSALCRIQNSLSPLKFLSFDSESGVADTLTLQQTIPCSRDISTVTLHFSLYGSTSSLLLETFTVLCLRCGASQIRINEVAVDETPIWFCRSCQAGQYIINQDQDSCQDCPSGNKDSFLDSILDSSAWIG
jgi:hypothetical protein